MNIAIIGAGMAGVACAGGLVAAGHEVRLFDKGRGSGGRTATRRAPPWTFDHGAQYLTVRDRGFRETLAPLRTGGTVAPWNARFVNLAGGHGQRLPDAERLVGVPGMNAVVRELAADLHVQFDCRVDDLERKAAGWYLTTVDGRVGGFDRVISAIPAPQAAALLRPHTDMVAELERIRMTPCIAAMAAFDAPLPVAFDAAFVQDAPVAWVARESSKPGRSDGERWVLHASVSLSEERGGVPADAVAAELVAEFATAAAAHFPEPVHLVGHRWGYARAKHPLGRPFLLDEGAGLAAIGDWCVGERVEDAFLSGTALARTLTAVDDSAPSRTANNAGRRTA